MNVFGIGLPELAVIAAIGLLVFGPKRLPELGRTLGRTLRGFQSASQEFEQEFRTAMAPLEEATKLPTAAPVAAIQQADAVEAPAASGPSAPSATAESAPSPVQDSSSTPAV